MKEFEDPCERYIDAGFYTVTGALFAVYVHVVAWTILALIVHAVKWLFGGP